jgi:hypothetical protein
MSCCAFYLVKTLAEKSDYWGWLKDFSSKWAVVSQYLDGDYRVLSPSAMQQRLQDTILNRKLLFKEADYLKGPDFHPVNLSYRCGARDAISSPGVMCVLFKGPKDPVHAIAFVRRGRRIFFMDPELGEFSFADPHSLELWLQPSDLFKDYSEAQINYYAVR